MKPHYFCSIFLVALFGAATLRAARARFWVTESAPDFSAGTAHGISVLPSGGVVPGWHAEKMGGLSGAKILCAAEGKSGVLLFGTGSPGKIFVQQAGQEARLLTTLPEPAVTALAVSPGGEIFAATSPQGKIYRIAGDHATAWFDPKAQYIWALAWDTHGVLFAATGLPGRIFKISSEGHGAPFYEPADEQVRSLLFDSAGRLWAGTAGKGLLLRVDPTGKAETIYDSRKIEISSLTLGKGGTVYAAAVSGAPAGGPAAGVVPREGVPAMGKPEGKSVTTSGGDEGTVTVTVSTSGSPAPPPSAVAPGGAVSSEIIEVLPDDSVVPVWSSANQMIYSLRLGEGSGDLLAATGPDGKVYRFRDGEASLEASFDEKNVIALLPDGIAADSPAAAYRLSPADEGELVSAVKDTGRRSRFGAFRRDADIPAGATLSFSFRSGNAATPDATWSGWSSPSEAAALDRIPAPPGRFLQWKVIFRRGRANTKFLLSRVECAFANFNIPPRIEEVSAVRAGPWEGLTPASSDAAELAGGLDSIFAEGSRRGAGPPLPAGRNSGIVVLQWKATDPDGDPLVYDLAVKPVGRATWVSLRRGLTAPSFSFDSSLLPDGNYLFRLTASDRQHNPDDPRVDVRVSTPVLINNTPPGIEVISSTLEKGNEIVKLRVSDALSPLSEVLWSLNARPWEPATADDGMTDSRQESYTIVLKPGDRGGYLLIRAVDTAGNVSSISLAAR